MKSIANSRMNNKTLSILTSALKPNELSILCFMASNMNAFNLLQVTIREITLCTSIRKEDTISRLLKGLIQKGCIAIKRPRSGREGTVYMINPLIATKGWGGNLH